MRFTRLHILTFVVATLLATRLSAQEPERGRQPAEPDSSTSMEGMDMEEHMPAYMIGPLGIPIDRGGSGTTWLPDATFFPYLLRQAGAWTLMGHGNVFGIYNRQTGPRGGSQVMSFNWLMFMASRNLAGGRLQFRTMLSAEPWTVPAEGYPLLLQSGETFNGAALHDRQHPHDLFMELGVLYERPITETTAFELYLAPAGEPATGPVAFMHRPSAINDPTAPIGHHWQDATHITFGVITAGLFTKTMKAEISIFNGREPNEDRTDFDFAGRSLDSYATRLMWNANESFSFAASYAFLKSPEELHPGESMQRLTFSLLNGFTLRNHFKVASAIVIGANREGDGSYTPGFLLEANAEIGTGNAVFGRLEHVRKSYHDLDIAGEGVLPVSVAALGVMREVVNTKSFTLGIGARGSVNFLPAAVREVYGRLPTGLLLFIRLRPAAATPGTMPGM
jgi:hypothetical protein